MQKSTAASGKYLNIGNEGFRSIRNSEYVDKTGLIRFMNKCLDTPQKPICVTFTKQAVREQAIPFIISRNMPNEETMQAIKEVERLRKDPNKRTYSSFDELLEEVKADV